MRNFIRRALPLIATSFGLTLSVGVALAVTCPQNSSTPVGVQAGSAGGAVNLTSTSTSTNNFACFLSGIEGQFHGTKDRASIYAQGGYWKLQATAASTSTGVQAQASCITLPKTTTVSAEAVWSQASGKASGSRVEIPLTGFAHCYLTAMSGHFQGGGEAVWITRDGSSGVMRHYLNGIYGAAGLNIEGRARCFAASTYNSKESLTQYMPNDLVQVSGIASYPLASGLYDCKNGLLDANRTAITGISGRFEGYGEYAWISIYPHPPGSSCAGPGCQWNYYMGLASQQQGVGVDFAAM